MASSLTLSFLAQWGGMIQHAKRVQHHTLPGKNPEPCRRTREIHARRSERGREAVLRLPPMTGRVPRATRNLGLARLQKRARHLPVRLCWQNRRRRVVAPAAAERQRRRRRQLRRRRQPCGQQQQQQQQHELYG